ncbi:hypothetical protein ACLKA7_004884 [Drosophila subpalustris]
MVQLPAVHAAQPRAQPAAPLPIRPLTPTIIVVMDSDEEPARPRYDPVVRREVPMTPGRGLSLEARPPGPKQFDELIGIAWPSEVSRAAWMLNPRKRRIRVVWSGGVRFML